MKGEAAEVNLYMKDTKKLKVNKKLKLAINVFNCKYDIVREVARESFNMRIFEEDIDDFDIFWSDGAIQPEKLQRLKPYQRINHFPGMYVLARKNYLGKHLNKLKRKFDEEYNYFPDTWMLPTDSNDLKNAFMV